MEVKSKSGSNVRKVTWMIEILKALDEYDTESHSNSEDANGEITKLTWRIDNFSSFKNRQRLCSENFSVDGNKWNIVIYPKGSKNSVDHFSIFLSVADSATLPSGWSRFVQLGFAVIDQIDRTNSITKVAATHEFKATSSELGYPSFLALSELEDPERGYLVDDACLVEAYISADKTEGLILRELVLKTDSDKHKTKEVDGVKAIEPEEPTVEDIKTFFTSLESELSSSDTVFSKEEAKEALAKVDEALNMTPLNFYDSGKFSSLEKAFKTLASFDCSSTSLTIEQKNELLAMEESLKELADRAAKAVEDKSRLTEKKSMKLKITRKLDSNLIRYKEVESEMKHVEQKLAALLAERKGIFISSKEMKVELETLGNEWEEYEAISKAAEEEERSVEAEWGRMKGFISSIKGRM